MGGLGKGFTVAAAAAGGSGAAAAAAVASVDIVWIQPLHYDGSTDPLPKAPEFTEQWPHCMRWQVLLLLCTTPCVLTPQDWVRQGPPPPLPFCGKGAAFPMSECAGCAYCCSVQVWLASPSPGSP